MFHKSYPPEDEDKTSPNDLFWFSHNGKIINPDETSGQNEDLPFENLQMPRQNPFSPIWSCICPCSSALEEKGGYQIVTAREAVVSPREENSPQPGSQSLPSPHGEAPTMAGPGSFAEAQPSIPEATSLRQMVRSLSVLSKCLCADTLQEP